MKFALLLIFLVTLSLNTFAGSDSVLDIIESQGISNVSGSRAWREPNFSKQKGALGYDENTFDVPKGLEKQVNFWKKIYTKYNTNQGVLHDGDDVSVIYEEIDFSRIEKNSELNPIQKEKAKKKLVEDTQERIAREKGIDKSRVRFQLGLRDRFIAAIFLSGRYLESMERIFKEADLPIELTRIVFVESSFNVLARSKVGASGLWQIMKYTARGRLTMNSAIDNRNQPLEATKMAARLLTSNFRMLESWPLAVTGYNHGPSGVKKMVTKYKTRNIVDLIENVTSRKSFGFASQNFYASFLAALEVEKNAPEYFGKVLWSKALDQEAIKLPKPVSYATVENWFDGNDLKLQIFNPHIESRARKGKVLIPKGTIISVPSQKYDLALVDLGKASRTVASIDKSENNSKIKTQVKKLVKKSDKKLDSKNDYSEYVVNKGDTVFSIARAYKIKVSKLLAINDLDMSSKIKIGQKLKIP